MPISDDELLDFRVGPSSNRPRENKIEAAAVQYAIRRGWVSKKVGTNAWPDRVFIRKAPELLWVEFKRPGEVLRANQRRRCEMVKSRGYRVIVIDSKEQFADAFGT